MLNNRQYTAIIYRVIPRLPLVGKADSCLSQVLSGPKITTVSASTNNYITMLHAPMACGLFVGVVGTSVSVSDLKFVPTM